jgi:hypothetical protein
MSAVSFLFDEHVPRELATALRTAHPTIDIIRVDEANGPPKGTPDPDLLVVAEQQQRMFVTDDKKSMPGHLAGHYAQGGHTWGVATLRPHRSLSSYGASLSLIWQASEADEWIDQMLHLPL